MYSTQLLIAGRSLREIAIQKVSLRNSAVSLSHFARPETSRHVASIVRINYISNTWNLYRAILYQYVTENVIDTGGCCRRSKALFPGRVPHVRLSVFRISCRAFWRWRQ
jgi:hypothetical protein